MIEGREDVATHRASGEEGPLDSDNGMNPTLVVLDEVRAFGAEQHPRRDEDGLCAGREPAETSPTGHLGTCGECGQDGLRIDPDGNVWAHLPRLVAPSA